MYNYKRLIAGLLAASIVSSSGCSTKKVCNNPHIDEYFLMNQDISDDDVKPTVENVISAINDDFFSLTSIFDIAYTYDERIEAQFKAIDGLKYSNNNEMRIILQEFVKHMEKILRMKPTAKDITYLLKKIISEDSPNTIMSIIFTYENVECSYRLLKNEQNYSSFIRIANEDTEFQCGKLVRINDCANENNEKDYQTSDIYCLKSVKDDSVMLRIIKEKNVSFLELTNGKNKIFSNKSIEQDTVDWIIDIMKLSILQEVTYEDFLISNIVLLSPYFNKGDYKTYLKNIDEKKPIRLIPKSDTVFL